MCKSLKIALWNFWQVAFNSSRVADVSSFPRAGKHCTGKGQSVTLITSCFVSSPFQTELEKNTQKYLQGSFLFVFGRKP